MYPRPHTEVRKGNKASANPIEVVVDNGNATGKYHAYGHETPIVAQAPTMAKQLTYTCGNTRAISQFKMATATTEGLIGDIPYQLVGNSALVHTRAKVSRLFCSPSHII
ncbi:hypothetical protein D8674_025777 [Pyrus ussuriensis x Pyrus communis]|uniref:Uncharacterized protein n=1 Tax=Pyrus ussuriensis x Pyrus communis TaxID=2448454 RepID=A0A5N5I7W7_9ROSA|nr:hypothetical protein D8674_025777 [Pyrus ussuriensis x Pyrus communis]